MVRKHSLHTATAVTAAICTLGLGFTNAPAGLASTKTYPMHTKAIVESGKAIATPQSFVANGTTYMQVYTVQQVLHSVGIESTWDGTNLKLTVPGTITPNLSELPNGTKGADHILINGESVMSLNSLVAVPYKGAQPTTFMPIYNLQLILRSVFVDNAWNGVQWSVNPNPALLNAMNASKNSNVSSSLNQTAIGGVNFTSGVVPSIVAAGPDNENWFGYQGTILTKSTPVANGQSDVLMQNLRYTKGSNILPIAGKITKPANYPGGDILVWVYPTDANYQQIGAQNNGEEWMYSIPVQANGTFQGTILLPFQAPNVSVSLYFVKDSSTDHNWKSEAFLWTSNSKPNLSQQQLGMLQSWAVNYNETSTIPALANQIVTDVPKSPVDGHTRAYDEIKAVSDWVSANMQYNFPVYQQGLSVDQQSTDIARGHVGVSEDYAYLSAALLRSLNIPTRLVQGEAYWTDGTDEGPHYWNEAWDGTQWVTFDAAQDQNYTQDTTVALPAGTSNTYFDPQNTGNAALWNQTHPTDAPYYR